MQFVVLYAPTLYRQSPVVYRQSFNFNPFLHIVTLKRMTLALGLQCIVRVACASVRLVEVNLRKVLVHVIHHRTNLYLHAVDR